MRRTFTAAVYPIPLFFHPALGPGSIRLQISYSVVSTLRLMDRVSLETEMSCNHLCAAETYAVVCQVRENLIREGRQPDIGFRGRETVINHTIIA